MSLRMLRFLTAGESHGPLLVGILDGLPAGIPLDSARVDADLKRRMAGHGRGKRMKIEADAARFVGGVRHGETLGSPVAWLIENRDWVNWQHVMDAAPRGDGGVAESGNSPSRADARRVTRPRPGHADIAGGLKYDRTDLRDILERASARETASRVAAGAVARQFLRCLDIEVASHVTRIGSAGYPDDAASIPFAAARDVEDSPVRCADADVQAAMIAAIDHAHNELETLGGSFEVIATGMPPGLGSHTQWDRRLEARLGQALLSIQAQKAVEIGPAVWCSRQSGSAVHDPIEHTPTRRFGRPSNMAGGTEGGMTYGGELRLTVHMKPLATLRQPLPSVDILTGAAVDAVVQRSDVCAVPAAGVVGEAMVALVLADACLEKFGGDSLRETRRNLDGYLEQIDRYPEG
jgi:chorismate synthase